MSKKEKIQLGITGVFLILLAVVLLGPLSVTREEGVFPFGPGLDDFGQDFYQERLEGKNLYRLAEKSLEGISFERDPFSEHRRGRREKAERPGLALLGIVWDKDNPRAILNDFMVEVGDSVEGKEVVEIGRDYIILFDGESQQKLSLDF